MKQGHDMTRPRSHETCNIPLLPHLIHKGKKCHESFLSLITKQSQYLPKGSYINSFSSIYDVSGEAILW